MMSTIYDKSIFKAYDIRGIVGKTLSAEVAHGIGLALGTEALKHKLDTIVVGRDGRLSGEELCHALANGIRTTGVNVIDVGMVATPMLYYAAHQLSNASGVMVTGSHNPPDYNGFKMLLGGATLSGPDIQALYQTITQADFNLSADLGTYTTHDIEAQYMAQIVGDIRLARPLKIVLDCGNGVAGAFAPKLFQQLGCDIMPLFCDVDGTFPNHHPDPAQPENLQDVILALKNSDADLGLAFDGDGDRLGVVTKEGNIIWPDRQMMLFAEDILSRQPNAEIIFDVKCTRNLAPYISERGGRPLMAKTGHSFMKKILKERGAALAGELSGHIFFQERWFGFDDGLYTGARLLEILSKVANPSARLNALPDALSTPELNMPVYEEGLNHRLLAELADKATFNDALNVITLDGLRVEYADGFGLMRGSNTTPVITFRFEADNPEAIQRIQADFKSQVSRVTDLPMPF